MPSPTVCFLGNEVSLSGKGKASEICVIDRRSWGMEFWHVLSPLFPLQYNRQFNLVSSCDLSWLSAMSLPSYARRLNYSKKSLKWFCRKNYMMWNYLYHCAFRVFFVHPHPYKLYPFSSSQEDAFNQKIILIFTMKWNEIFPSWALYFFEKKMLQNNKWGLSSNWTHLQIHKNSFQMSL